MEERAVHISSVNRVKGGEGKPESFTIRFDPPILLHDKGVINDVALDVASLTYSWHSVAPRYNNDTLKYSHDGGKTWNEVMFPSGAYGFIDLNDFLHLYMSDKGHEKADGSFDIDITFVHTNFVMAVEVSGGYQLDLRGTKFGELIGFDEEVITETKFGTKTPNITNSIDSLLINLDFIGNSIVGGDHFKHPLRDSSHSTNMREQLHSWLNQRELSTTGLLGT